MSNVWLAIPSAREPAQIADVLAEWRARGYRIALWRDTWPGDLRADLILSGAYPGYHSAVNRLCASILSRERQTQWIVTGGDDMFPDPHKTAEEIADECTAHFGGTFGIMQPTGDGWSHPERICGSPFMGREWCCRMYGGRGPFFEGYPHMWGDEEMHDIALARGVLWNRPDLAHFHRHFQRVPTAAEKPAWMQRNDACYAQYEPLFRQRKAAGYPGSEPIL